MLHFYDKVPVMEIESSPNVLAALCPDGKCGLLVDVFVGQQLVLSYYDVPGLPFL